MKKKGRPTVADRDRMVPMSSSVPAPLCKAIEKLARVGKTKRSTMVVELLEIGLKTVERRKATLQRKRAVGAALRRQLDEQGGS